MKVIIRWSGEAWGHEALLQEMGQDLKLEGLGLEGQPWWGHTDPSLPLPPVRKELPAEATVSGSSQSSGTNTVKASTWQHDTLRGGLEQGSWDPAPQVLAYICLIGHFLITS